MQCGNMRSRQNIRPMIWIGGVRRVLILMELIFGNPFWQAHFEVKDSSRVLFWHDA